MVEISKEAQKLNETLEKECPVLFKALSKTGKKAFFPTWGVFAQCAQAANTTLKATAGQAFEESKEPMVLESLKKNIALDKKTFLYSFTSGKKELREAWNAYLLKKNPTFPDNATLPIVTSGLTHGITIASTLFVDEEDTLIIPSPYWGNYNLIFRQANILKVQSFVNNTPNIEGLKEQLKGENKKQTLLLNFPNNPSGYTLTEKECKTLTQIIKESAERNNTLIVIMDDAYFGLVYEKGIATESMFSKLATHHENVVAVKIDGISKELFAWGLRIGFITIGSKKLSQKAKEAIENKITGIVRGTISSACTVSQTIALNALKSKTLEKEQKEKYVILKSRYEKVKEVLQEEKYKEFFEPLPFNSGYFMCIKLKKHDANTIRTKLIQEYDTGVIALDNLLRIAYSSLGKDQIKQVFDNVYECCKSL